MAVSNTLFDEFKDLSQVFGEDTFVESCNNYQILCIVMFWFCYKIFIRKTVSLFTYEAYIKSRNIRFSINIVTKLLIKPK